MNLSDIDLCDLAQFESGCPDPVFALLRREAPDGTLLSEVVNAEIPGEHGAPRQLDELEAIRFFNLLITGGTETTRNAIAGGYYALLTHPLQLA